RGEHPGDFIPERLSISACAMNEDDEVVRVADQFHHRASGTPVLRACPCRAERIPLTLEMPVQARQDDIRQKRRQNPSLRSSRVGVPVHPVLGKDTSFQEPPYQSQYSLIRDSFTDLLHEPAVIDLV